MLHGIEFGRPDEGSKVRARALRIEFALGVLMRGEWRIADARLEGPEFAAGLDNSGRIAWPVPSKSASTRRAFRSNGSDRGWPRGTRGRCERHRGSRSRRSNSRAICARWRGRSRAKAPSSSPASTIPIASPTGRVAEDGGVKVRLTVDPIERPLTADADVSIWIEQGMPRFEGSVADGTAGRPRARGRAGADHRAWRVTSRIKGDSTAAVLDQIEFQYGPDDRAIKLRGDAKLTFGSRPHINGVLSSPQIDLDRVLALPDATRRRPLAAIKTLGRTCLGRAAVAVPDRARASVESADARRRLAPARQRRDEIRRR